MAFDFVATDPPALISEVGSVRQSDAQIAALVDRFVVVWVDGTGSAGDVRGRYVDRRGAPIGPSFLVGESPAGRQSGPSVASLGGGGYVVVWTSCPGSATDGCTTRARRYSPALVPDAERSIAGVGQTQVRLARSDFGGSRYVITYQAEVGEVPTLFADTIDENGARVCSASRPRTAGTVENTLAVSRKAGIQHVAIDRNRTLATATRTAVRTRLGCAGQPVSSARFHRFAVGEGIVGNLQATVLASGSVRVFFTACCRIPQNAWTLTMRDDGTTTVGPGSGPGGAVDVAHAETAGGAAVAAFGYRSAAGAHFRFNLDAGGSSPGEPRPAVPRPAVLSRGGAAALGSRIAIVYADQGRIRASVLRKIGRGVSFVGTPQRDAPELSTVFGDAAVGNGGPDTLTGYGGPDRLAGKTGRDRLSGGRDRDVLEGGAHADIFAFDVPAGADDADVVADFRPEEGDRLALAAAAFPGLPIGSSPPLLTGSPPAPPATADPVLLYDDRDGLLSFDRDGNGPVPAAPVARLTGQPPLAGSMIAVQ